MMDEYSGSCELPGPPSVEPRVMSGVIPQQRGSCQICHVFSLAVFLCGQHGA